MNGALAISLKIGMSAFSLTPKDLRTRSLLFVGAGHSPFTAQVNACGGRCVAMDVRYANDDEVLREAALLTLPEISSSSLPQRELHTNRDLFATDYLLNRKSYITPLEHNRGRFDLVLYFDVHKIVIDLPSASSVDFCDRLMQMAARSVRIVPSPTSRREVELYAGRRGHRARWFSSSLAEQAGMASGVAIDLKPQDASD